MNTTDPTRAPPREGEIVGASATNPRPWEFNPASYAERRSREYSEFMNNSPYNYPAGHPRLRGDATRIVGPAPDMQMLRYRSWPERVAIAFLRGANVRLVWAIDRILETGVKMLRLALYFVVLPALAWIALLSWQSAQQAETPDQAAEAAGGAVASTLGSFVSGFWNTVTGNDDTAKDEEKSER